MTYSFQEPSASFGAEFVADVRRPFEFLERQFGLEFDDVEFEPGVGGAATWRSHNLVVRVICDVRERSAHVMLARPSADGQIEPYWSAPEQWVYLDAVTAVSEKLAPKPVSRELDTPADLERELTRLSQQLRKAASALVAGEHASIFEAARVLTRNRVRRRSKRG